MTSPFKSTPKTKATCNNCESTFTYKQTTGTGRLCRDCHDTLDDPSACDFTLETRVDAVTKELRVTTTVSHDQPTSVHIPPYRTEEHERENEYPIHRGFIANVTIETLNGDVLHEETWVTERTQVFDPTSECAVNINAKHTVGSDGSKTWGVTVSNDSVFDHDAVRVRVTFPAITDVVSKSSLEETVNIPAYILELD